MKKSLLFFYVFVVLSSICIGQKTGDEIQIIHPLLELVPISEIQDFKAYQERHFKNPRARLSTLRIDENTHSQYYRRKGTHDIVGIGTILNKQSTSDWEDHVRGHAHLFSGEQPYSIEYLDLNGGRGAILLVKDPIRIVDYCYYQNKGLGVTLLISYISNGTFEERVENMKDILKSLKVEVK